MSAFIGIKVNNYMGTMPLEFIRLLKNRKKELISSEGLNII
jgi:hypothetical protein